MIHKTRTKALSWLLSLALVLGLMPGMSLTAYAATSYNLWVGGVEVKSDKTSDTGWSYNAENNTLTLTNYNYTGDGGTKYSGIYYNGSSDLTVSLTGNNVLTINNASNQNSYGIYFQSNNHSLTINGGGNFTIIFGEPNGNPTKLNAIHLEPGSFIMNGTGTVTANGGKGQESYGLFASRDVTFNSGTFIGEGSTTTNYESRGIGTGGATYSITVNDGTVRGIAPVNNDSRAAYGFQHGNIKINGGTLIAQGKTPFNHAFNDYFSAGTGKQLVIQGGTSESDLSDKGTISGTSGCTYVKLTVSDIPAHSVTINPGDNMTKTTDSGAESQTDLSGAMTDVVYTADDGYYFPTDYSVTAVNGISVTRDSYTQITVSGTPTADATITLTAPTAKTKPDAPTTAAATDCTTTENNDGTLTGVTADMEYKKSDATEWTAGTGSDITGLVPGTYYVRVKATDTTNASNNQELTIEGFISYTVTFKVVNGKWNDETTADKTVTLTGHDGDSLKLTADQIPAVGTKPNNTYKAGSWDVTPRADTAITEATTYTYTYAAKEASVVIKAPEAKTLTYNGQAQELVTAGTAEGGTLYYAVTTENVAPTDESLYTTSIPTGTNAGTYYVWYKVVGDDNHSDTSPVCVTVRIGETAGGEAGGEIEETGVAVDSEAAQQLKSRMNDLAEKELETLPTGSTVVYTLSAEQKDTDKLTETERTALEEIREQADAAAGTEMVLLDFSVMKTLTKPGEAAQTTGVYELGEDTTPLAIQFAYETAGRVFTLYQFHSASGSVSDGAVRQFWPLDSQPNPVTKDHDGRFYVGDGSITVYTNQFSLFTLYYAKGYTVTFNPNGGTVTRVSAVTGADGKLSSLPTPTRSGSYRFDGWYTAKTSGEKVTTETVFTDNAEIFARWTTTSSGGGNSGGGGGGYSGGGNSSDNAVTVPVSGDANTVSVSATVSGTTATVAKPTASQLEKVIGAGVKTGTVVIDLSGLKTDIASAGIPTDTLKEIARAVNDSSNDASALTIKLTDGSITFDGKALAAIVDQSKGSEIRISLDSIRETRLNDAQHAALKELDVQTVYDAYIVSNGVRISDLKGGSATVTAPYTLKNSQQAKGLVVWYVAESGEKEEVPASYGNKEIRFTVTHFSNYILTYDAERVKEETPAGTDYKTCPQDATCPISAFSDAGPTAWYHDGVHYVLDNGIMSGMGNGLFAPNSETSRAMIAQILWNMEGRPVVNFLMTYKDVDQEAWYAEAIRWANSEGLMDGYGNDRFGPNDTMTREQLVTVMYRYAQRKGIDVSVGEDTNILSYDDAYDVSEWAASAMQWAVGSGLISGRTSSTLNPKDTATRAEIATIMMRYCTEIAE